ncbi:hypothetical protein KJ762_02745 [bacterium]|nr:hypothetical protein [bacterium]MBU1633409.1 hypothetical protein [bacterium]MBU1875304.1 hypothetical protein [bacterium]
MQAIVDLLCKYKQRDTKGYAIESLWKFLIYSEIGRELYYKLIKIHPSALSDDEEKFVEYISSKKDIFLNDFSIRLENCIDSLLNDSNNKYEKVQDIRLAISERLHSSVLKILSGFLYRLFHSYSRIAILVDNIDKAWEDQGNIQILSELIIGLLRTTKIISDNIQKNIPSYKHIFISLCVFLRTDIFYKVKQVSREPDKISFSKIEWNDPQLLIRIIEERFIASNNYKVDSSTLWDKYFCKKVKNKPIKDYIISVILFRPRDILYFLNSAVATAINRSHSFVEENDIITAEKEYSQYAMESIVVENTLTNYNIENLLYEFAGNPEIINYDELIDTISKVPHDKKVETQESINLLCSLTFLGIEIDKSKFVFSEDPQDFRKYNVIAQKYSKTQNMIRRYRVHPAFHAFLEITNN